MNEVYQMVTDQVTAALEADTIPWRKSWSVVNGIPRNAWNKPYRGINVFMLTLQRMAQGYESNFWVTYKQAAKEGGQVRKGEKSTLVTFWKTQTFKEFDADKGREVTKTVPMLRYFRVFNLDQIDNMKMTGAMKAEKVAMDEPEKVAIGAINETAESIIGTYFARDEAPTFMDGQAGCFFRPATDEIGMPNRGDFDSLDEFYVSLYHEMGHSTGHHSRLVRKVAGEFNHFGDDKYSAEELVAEFTAAFLAAESGVDNTLENSVAYIKGWLSKIKSDPKVLVWAAGKAQRAADYVKGEEWTGDK